MSSVPLVSIVIVNYESSYLVQRCLDSLREQALQHEVMIVDNPSPANDVENLELTISKMSLQTNSSSSVRLVRSEQNVGYGMACNLGLLGTSSPYVCILNPDTVLPPEALGKWLQALQQLEYNTIAPNKPVGLLTPCLLNDNGTPQRSTYQFQNMFNYWLYHSFLAGFLKHLRKRLGVGSKLPHHSNSGIVPVDWAMGAAYMLPRQAWDTVSGFSSRYFLYAEDTDLCWRLRDAGYNVMFAPGVSIVHSQGETSVEARGQALIRLFRGLHTFIYEHYGYLQRTGVRISVIIDMLIRLVVYLPILLLRPTHPLTRSRLAGIIAVLKLYLYKPSA